MDVAALMALLTKLYPLIIPILTPIIISLVKKYITDLPKPLIPYIAAILGILIQAITGVSVAIPGLDMIPGGDGAGLGLLGVGVREAIDQSKKSLQRQRVREADEAGPPPVPDGPIPAPNPPADVK